MNVVHHELIEFFFKDGVCDTSTHRYCIFEGGTVIKRIRLEVLDTDACLSDASAINPDGWEYVAKIE